MIITPTPENQNMGVDFSLLGDINHYLAIHSSKARSVGKVSYDGEKYTMVLRFYIFDYYDWDKNIKTPTGVVSPEEMYKLCRCGHSRFYENWGLFETQFSWIDANKDGQQVLTDIKRRLALGIY